MSTRKYQFPIFFLMALLAGFITFSLSDTPTVASGELPPRATMIPPTPTTTAPVIPTAVPTPTPTIEEASKGVSGGQIRFQVHFSSVWPWETANWQGLWTVVQWDDGMGHWYDVEGWRGNLDSIAQTEGWTAEKVWWVGESDLGKGPFRWQVFLSQGGRLLATSEPFTLPAANGEVVTVEASVGP